MALNEKERARIVEEEQLRYETRRGLDREFCHKHRSHRWKWWLAAIVLLVLVCRWHGCGWGSCSQHGWGSGLGWHGQMGGHRCSHGEEAAEEGEKGSDEEAPKAKPAVKPAKVAPAPAAKK